MFAVLITEKGGAQKKLEFDKNEVTIGRVEGNDIVLPKGNVSKRHSRVVLKDSRFIVVDLKSTNGTYVNGRKIMSPLVVKGGDKIYIGDFIITLEELGGGSAAVNPPLPTQNPPIQSAMPPAMPSEAPQPMPSVAPSEHRAPFSNPAPAPAPQERREERAEPVKPLVVADTSGARPQNVQGAPPRGPSAGTNPAPAERFALDEEPVERGSSLPRDARKGPVSRSERRARPVGLARNPIAHVLYAVSPYFDPFAPIPPEAAAESRWKDARGQIDLAVDRLEREGGLAGFDRDQLTSIAMSEALGLGPISLLLEDPTVMQIRIDGPSHVQIDRGQGLQSSQVTFSCVESLTATVQRLAVRAGLENVSAEGNSRPIDATMSDGLHIFALMPPITVGAPLVELRRTGRAGSTLEILQGRGVLSPEIATVLRTAAALHRNMLVVGPQAAGVSDVVGALVGLSPSDDSVLLIEHAAELALGERRVTRLLASGGIGLGELVLRAGRMNFHRLVVDGIQGGDLRDVLVQFSARGHGCIGGLRASIGSDLLGGLEATAALGGPSAGVATLVRNAVHLVIQVGYGEDGVRRIMQVAEVVDEQLNVLSIWDGHFQQRGKPSFLGG